MAHALEVYHNDRLIFHSDGKWLHPLFELYDFLNAQSFDPSHLHVRDKIIGRAAALLMMKLGIRTVHAAMLSTLGQQVLDHFNVDYTYDTLVDRIVCKTEDILKDELDPEHAFVLLSERAGRLVKN
ncbi:DUF1893 domain-containing protein [candidate division KSB1 bacterium]|nr:DUF1893 domain-containing protein [candidate division KSB1 bacterium]